MSHPADLAYLTATGLTLCEACAERALLGTLEIEQVVRMNVLSGEQETIIPLHSEAGVRHTLVDSWPVQEPTACEACLAFLAPETR